MTANRAKVVIPSSIPKGQVKLSYPNPNSPIPRANRTWILLEFVLRTKPFYTSKGLHTENPFP